MFQAKRYFPTGIAILAILSIVTGWVEQTKAQQKYPTKPIEIIVAWGPGAATDMSARLMADYVSKKWKVPVNVVNKPGGASIPGVLEVYNAKPDGYTLLQDGMASSSLLPTVVGNAANLPFKIMDRTFIGIILASPLFYIVQPGSPLKSLKDVEAEVKTNPGSFTWTSTGGGGIHDAAMRKFMKAIGVDILKTRPVVCKGGNETVPQTIAGAVKVGLGTPYAAGPALAGKMIRLLALTSDKRMASYPDVPTVAEAGYPTAIHQDRYGPSGPPNLPSHIVEIWAKALEEMIRDPEFLSKLDRLGLITFYRNGRETRELVLKEMEE